MKTLGQLKDEIEFEAGLHELKSVGGWLELVIGETLDSYTSQVKYQDLYVADATIALTAAQTTINLPDSLQHLDWDTLRFREEASIERETFLDRRRFIGLNEGPTRFVRLASDTDGDPRTLLIYPNSEITATDTLVYSYWRKGSAFALGDDSIVHPDALVSTVKREAIARASMIVGNKNAGNFMTLAREAHSRHFGSVDLGSANDNE